MLFAQNPNRPGIVDPNYQKNIPGLHLLGNADLVIWFTRFRELPTTQMQYVNSYLAKGKPLIAIRTATHAFNFEDQTHPFTHYGWNYKGKEKNWHFGFGKRILGETWFTHHGDHKHQSTRGIVPKEMANHPILNGIGNGSIWGATDVYGIRTPITKDAQILVLGQTVDRTAPFDGNDLYYGMRESDTVIANESGPKDKRYNPNANMPPIVWLTSFQLKDGQKGKALVSTIGASTDMLDEEVRRLFVNATYSLLNLPVPENSNVEVVGTYHPSQFGFHDNQYWVRSNLKVSDFGKE